VRLPTLSALLCGLAALAAGCGHNVGDSCTSNVDCSPAGDRICDTAQLSGYCTVEGCDLTTCPSESACIRFFSAGFLSRTCNPATEGIANANVTPTHDCGAGEMCLSSGFCTQRTSERRFCMLKCGTDGDCRDGYACVRTGTAGAEAIFDPQSANAEPVRFCAQKP
jgi:hypothetical protein